MNQQTGGALPPVSQPEETMAKSPTMKFYSGTLLLAGSQLNQVPIKCAPAPEIIMLKHLHGNDAVKDLRPAPKGQEPHFPADVLDENNLTKDHGWSNKATRAYLRHRYAAKGSIGDGLDKINRFFGNDMVPLPTELDIEVDDAAEKQREMERARLEAKVRAEVIAELEADMRAKIQAENESLKPDVVAAGKASAEAAAKAAAMAALG